MTSQSNSEMWNVLLVDDRPENLGFVRDALEHSGHQVRVAMSGPDALGLMKEHLPQFVLLDLEMPGMSGLEVLREIRGNDQLAGVVVIIMTAHTREEVEKDCMVAGANEVMSKPIRLSRLCATLSDLKGS